MMPAGKPNIVFVITDDQGYGDLGCNGNTIIQTPHINKLYEESIRFTDYHVGPTCAPTRAGLMTGHYHNSTGVWHTIGGRSLLRKDEVSLAKVFGDNGYATGIFGKWHLGDNYPYRPQDRGFKEAVVHGGGGIGQTPDYWGNDYFDDTYYDQGVPRKFTGYCTDVWFRLGLDFIERHKDEPFVCYIPTNAPHSPYQVEERYENLYRGRVPENRAKFYGMITNIDENVGGLRRRLEELGLADNTLFVFMTDNGTAEGCDLDGQGFVTGGYNSGMRGKKSSPYDGGHRVPFFLHWPEGGYTTGKDIDSLTSYVDFMPTLIEMCQLTIPETLSFDGTSLVPLLANGPERWAERAVVTDSQRVPDPIKWKASAVMCGKWRLINGKELYQLESDPGQRQDIAGQHPDVVEKLRLEYEVWWEKVSRQFNEEIPISIGSAHEPVTRINSHDWRGDAGDCAWNQGEIRAGKICNSYVEIDIETDGLYSFELRRWPEEEGSDITAGLPGELKGWFSGGKALPIIKAAISIQNYEAVSPVTDEDQQITFTAELTAGPTHLQTYLEDAEGNIRGAYYVYVRKLVP
jgi:arylsulfatase A-like enzyme